MKTHIDSLTEQYRWNGMLTWACCSLWAVAVVLSFIISLHKGFFTLSMALAQFTLLRTIRMRMARQMAEARKAESL